ncbi:hypothetical protein CEXT_718141, partial [Caerostris extrusa]
KLVVVVHKAKNLPYGRWRG